MKTIRLYLNRYFRIWPRMPSNFILKIFPKVYHTFGHTRTFFHGLQTNGDHQNSPKTILNKGSRTYNMLISKDTSRNEKGKMAPRRRSRRSSRPRSSSVPIYSYGMNHSQAYKFIPLFQITNLSKFIRS